MRSSWMFAAILLLGFFVAVPDEGTAATKKGSGGGGGHTSISLNFTKIEFGYRTQDTQVPPNQITDIQLGTVAGFAGGAGGGGTVLPTSSDSEVFDPDSLGRARAGSQNIYFTGAPGALPPLSSYHTSMDFTVPGTNVRGQSGVITVQHDPATSPDKSYWQASVDIAMPGATPNSFTFFVEANPDQPGLSLKSVQTAQGSLPGFSPVGSSFFDVFVELDYDPLAGPIDTSKPVIWVTTTTPEPASAMALVCVGLGLLRRRAR